MAQLATAQFGVVHRDQLARLGMDGQGIDARRRRRWLRRVLPNVYAVGHDHLDFRGRCKAALLWAGPGAILSHRTAAILWGLRPEDGAPASTQTRLKRELVAFLRELSRRVPVVLFVDDLHWADVPSADLLAYLGRHCPGLRLLLVAAYRRDELLLANHPFLPAQRDLQGRGVCRELAPGRLELVDVAHYLGLAFPGHDFPPDLAATLHARTGGSDDDLRKSFTLPTFDGVERGGAWNLTVVDGAAQDEGTLERWSLELR